MKHTLDALALIARAAGEAIMEVYTSDDFGARLKSDDSPLTNADLRAHRIIVDGLAAFDPTIPVLSEEEADIPFEARAGWQRYWLVDPLDGTKEFLSRNGEFTVNIALVEGHAPVAGVVFAPAVERLYVGARGSGARLSVSGERPQPIQVRRPPAAPLRVVGSRSHASPGLVAALPALGPHEFLAIGSSLKICLVAEGSADFYPRLGPTSEWDIAAAHAVLEAAGGGLTRLDGGVLEYNRKADYLNPHFLAFGDVAGPWQRFADSLNTTTHEG